jgi:DNA-binding LacI/PurR family transcriptional regulator
VARKKVRIEDVAKAAGVSITTVSRVINKVPTVSKSNRLKVEEAIRRMKFQPDLSAQRLARGKNFTVGLIIPRYEGIFHSFYGVELIRGVGSACDGLKLDLLLHITNARSFINLSAVGGVIFADIIGNQDQIREVANQGIPCIVINNHVDDMPVSYIAVNNLRGAKDAVQYLINLGHKRIATITGDLVTQAARERLEGYKQALREKSISPREDYILKGDYSRRSARQAAEKILELKPTPSAIFAASDDMAQEAISVIMEKGLKVPEHLSVIGFDDTPSALYGPVTLTTIRQPLFKMFQEAVSVLNSVMSGKHKTIVKRVLPTELIIRESCSKIS